MGGRGNRERMDIVSEQRIDISEGRTVERPGNEIALVAIGIRNPNKMDVGQISKHARVIAAHHADADHADA